MSLNQSLKIAGVTLKRVFVFVHVMNLEVLANTFNVGQRFGKIDSGFAVQRACAKELELAAQFKRNFCLKIN